MENIGGWEEWGLWRVGRLAGWLAGMHKEFEK